MTDLELSLITGGFTIAAVLVTFGGSYLLERARSRRDARQSRDSAIADLLTTSVELVLAVNTIRAAYQHRTNTRARMMVAAALLRDLPNLSSWKDFADRSVQKTILCTTIGLARDQDTESGPATSAPPAATMPAPRKTGRRRPRNHPSGRRPAPR